MCRSLIEGGRRCPGGHSSTRQAQAARQRLCRARKALAAAQAADDHAAAVAAQRRIDDAEQAVMSPERTARRPDRSAERLARAVASQEVIAARRLGGASAQTDLLELADGSKVIRKQARRFYPDGHNPEAEQAASLVARALGLPAPAIHREGDALYMEHVADAITPEEAGAWGGELPARFAPVPGSDQGRLMGLLDVLTHNTDRSDGNWMLDEANRLIPIDHGASYGDYITADRHPSLEYLSSPFADHYRQANPLTAADVAEVRDRLDRLRPDFERLERGHWLDYSLRALDHLAGNAAGTRNLIANRLESAAGT